jgi:hypothetical protein
MHWVPKRAIMQLNGSVDWHKDPIYMKVISAACATTLIFLYLASHIGYNCYRQFELYCEVNTTIHMNAACNGKVARNASGDSFWCGLNVIVE